MRSKDGNHAADIFAKNSRPRKGRRCGTIRNLHTWLPGSLRGTASGPFARSSRWSLKAPTARREVTSAPPLRSHIMTFKLKVWRQKDAQSEGRVVDYEARNIPEHASFLEMLDLLNEELEGQGEF